MSLLEQLKAEFPTRVCPPYGLCLVIPGDMFHPDWEGELDVDVINTDFGDPNKPVTLVPLKGEQATKEQFENSTPTAEDKQPSTKIEPKHRKHTPRPHDWRPEEIERLLKRWSEIKGSPMQHAEKLAPEFPGRDAKAIYQKHWALETGYNFNRRKIQKQKRKEEKSKTKDMPRGIAGTARKADEKVLQEVKGEWPLPQEHEEKITVEKLQKVLDIEPQLQYYGRNIIIKSDGTPHGTQIYVNGKEQMKVTELILTLKTGYLGTVQMKIYDI